MSNETNIINSRCVVIGLGKMLFKIVLYIQQEPIGSIGRKDVIIILTLCFKLFLSTIPANLNDD